MFADLLGDPPSKLNSKSVSPAKDVYKKNVILLHVQARGLAIYSGSILYSSVRFRNQQTQWIALPRTWPTRTHAISTWKLKRKGKLLCSEMAKYARRAFWKTTKIQTQSSSSARRHDKFWDQNPFQKWSKIHPRLCGKRFQTRSHVLIGSGFEFEQFSNRVSIT